MSTVRVKICGITNENDALKAISFGADAIGFIFHQPSPRYVEPETVAGIIKSLPPFVAKVGLFVNMPAADVRRIIDISGVNLLQFHGGENELFCSSFGMPWIKTIKMIKTTKVLEEVGRFSESSAVLLDTGDPIVAGGTGRSFDWTLIPRTMEKPFIVAGGLTPVNVEKVVEFAKPFAVDVCSGVERDKGKKHIGKMKEFISKAKKRDFDV